MAVVPATQDFQSLVLSCNKDGMDSLRKGQSQAAFEQFKYAEAILIAHQAEGDNTSLLAVTCNNLGCYYKKVGKLHGALSYLRRALKMEVDLGTDDVTVAGTHLNICAILSKLEKHDKAVQHALCALDLINKRVTGGDPDKVSQDDYSVLAIAYHNVAVERDFLHQYEKAAAAFQQGFDVAKKYLGEDHPLAVTLGKNCDAVLQKSQRLTKTPSNALATHRTLMKDAEWLKLTSGVASPGARDLPSLPPLPGTARAQVEKESPMMPSSRVRQDAADWVTGEVTSWTGLGQTPRAGKTLGAYEEVAAPALRLPPTGVDVELDKLRLAPHDYRPNRQIKGSTRTARVLRRTGLGSSTKHRDEVISGLKPSPMALQKREYVRKMAAERIQRSWRAWYKYCRENADWLTATWICATMIQAKWRSYHVRRVKKDRCATKIQRVMRGFLARRRLKRNRMAVVIQRHAIGMITRRQLVRLHRKSVKMQSLIRGFLARRRVRRKRIFMTNIALTLQCAVRTMIAKRRVRERREVKRVREARQKGATDIQRHFRGIQGRQRFDSFKQQYLKQQREHQAAVKLQAMARRDAATKEVDIRRARKLEQMNHAATFVRKMWLGSKARKKYQNLLDEFAAHERQVIHMQRHARGFLVRLRMWRQAIRMEEELWGAQEIQRIWRGYLGRVAFENKYEQMWRREMAAASMQRHLRGWLARTRVNRIRRRIARTEFERARLRFRAAQRLQALIRGMLTRKVTHRIHARKVMAAMHVQRIWRGHVLRKRLWGQVITLRATMIQAAMRGCLVRSRRFKVLAKVICVQRAWRRARRRPEAVRLRAKEDMQRRKENAAVIQAQFRKRREEQEVGRIQQEMLVQA